MGNLETLRKFVAPEIVLGAQSQDLVSQFAINLGVGHVLIVTDPGVTMAGWTGRAIRNLDDAGIASTVFDGITPNPKDVEVAAGAGVYAGNGCEAIVAIGGGSPMDCAKGIGIVCSNGGSILDYEGVDCIGEPCPPLICIPTTAGTSADVSQFSIITDTTDNRKIAIISKLLVPDVALIDPLTTTTMDPYLTACTGMDALVHAIEALVSNASSTITEVHALKAAELIRDNLLPAITDPTDAESRTKMMMASMHAGLAFSNASLGAVHAMSHSLGGLLDLAHGECNSILLPYVIEYNYQHATERYDKLAGILGTDNSDNRLEILLKSIRDMLRDAGITNSLADIGVKESDLYSLSEKAMADPCMVTNPRIPTRQEIEDVYRKALND